MRPTRICALLILAASVMACTYKPDLKEYTKNVDGKDYLIFALPDKYLTSEEIDKCITLDTLTMFHVSFDEKGPFMNLTESDFVNAGLSKNLYKYLMAEERKERRNSADFMRNTGIDLTNPDMFKEEIAELKRNSRAERIRINEAWERGNLLQCQKSHVR